MRTRTRTFLGRGQALSDEDADALLASPAGQHVQEMVRYSAVGTPAEVRNYIEAFAKQADADELITVHQTPTADGRLRSIELLADAVEIARAA
jgi:alkanesulfonate monooxygenase SsuD/methylene tetrahydromethanopterin reductase-like flavin-dependent oxidoreductase (luciferase family)